MSVVIPEPAPMPINYESWAQQLDLSNFVNTYYQYRDLRTLDSVKKVLIVGPGQGLDTQVLRWREFDIKTLDIDERFNPDYQGSVHDLSAFQKNQFDAVIASHVLEHLPVSYLDRALTEIARVAPYALIYLPVTGRHFQLRVRPGVKALDFSFFVNLYNYFDRPDGSRPVYAAQQHFWEVGRRGFRPKDIRRRLGKHFQILNAYRNPDWPQSLNFVLRAL